MLQSVFPLGVRPAINNFLFLFAANPTSLRPDPFSLVKVASLPSASALAWSLDAPSSVMLFFAAADACEALLALIEFFVVRRMPLLIAATPCRDVVLSQLPATPPLPRLPR